MATTDKIIDTAAERFTAAWVATKNKVNKLYNNFASQGLPSGVVMQEIAQINLTQLMLDDPALKKALAELTIAHVGVLKAMPSFASVDDAFLNALISIDNQVYVGQIGASATEIKTLMGSSITARLPEREFATALQATGLKDYQANALANDSLRVYQRNVTAEMANNSSPDKLYIWSGPLDSRTSPTCREMIAAGEQTYEWWKANYGQYIISGVHINDRHVLQPV